MKRGVPAIPPDVAAEAPFRTCPGSGPGMLESAVISRGRLQSDWGEPEMALTSHASDAGHSLDLTTGQIVAFTGLDERLAAGEIAAGLAEGRLVPIEPLPPSVEHRWMSESAAPVTHRTVQRILGVALNRPDAFRRFEDLLRGHPFERRRWFAFRGARLREAAREWLEENGVEAMVTDSRRSR